MPNCLYLTLSVYEVVILCIVNVLYFFNVLCNCVRVCNIVDWLLSLEWGVDGVGLWHWIFGRSEEHTSELQSRP